MAKDTITASVIQNWLDISAPKIPLTDKSMFKLIWSADERETRIGTFRTYVGDVFIREETRPESCLKYNYISERWILEQWFSPSVCLNPELPFSREGSFECIYVFEDSLGRPLPLNISAIQFIIQQCIRPGTSEMFKKSYAKSLKEAKEKLSYEKDMDALQDEGPLVSQFHDGSAIILPGKEINND